MRQIFLSNLLLISSYSVAADDQKPTNFNVTGNNKTALIATERQKNGWYDGKFHYAPGVRAGDYVFMSGMVAGAFGADEPIGKEAFQVSIRKAFQDIKDVLNAGGVDINNVVKIRTFHVFDSPYIKLNKHEQVAAVAEVKNEFITEPHPAWTAVGTTALYPDMGLVEIEVVAYAPQK